MAKHDTFYFEHDFNARRDSKMFAIREKFGDLVAIGTYWMLIEIMSESSKRSILFSDLDRISRYDLLCEPNFLRNFVDFACSKNVNLFQKNKLSFWSDRLRKDLNYKDIKSEKARESAQKRWGADAMRTHSDGNAQPTQPTNQPTQHNQPQNFTPPHSKPEGESRTQIVVSAEDNSGPGRDAEREYQETKELFRDTYYPDRNPMPNTGDRQFAEVYRLASDHKKSLRQEIKTCSDESWKSVSSLKDRIRGELETKREKYIRIEKEKQKGTSSPPVRAPAPTSTYSAPKGKPATNDEMEKIFSKKTS